MAGYTPVFRSILTSTIWLEKPHVKVVWWTMLLLADRNGVIEGSIPGLAKEAVVTTDQCREAIAVLMSPDPESRTKEHEGRRIEVVDGGWRMLNHRKYKDKLGLSNEGNRVRVARHREAKKQTPRPMPEPEATACNAGNGDVTLRNAGNGQSNDLDPRSLDRDLKERESEAEFSSCQQTNPEPPKPEPNARPRPRDPMGDQLRGTQPGQNPDVVKLFDVWRGTFPKYRNAKLGHPDGLVATAVWRALQVYSFDDCARVIKEAPRDKLVAGKGEDNTPHDALTYILGNENAFARILAAADARTAAPAKAQEESPSDMIRRMRNAEATP